MLVVDQFEELFTLCHDEFEREAFIDNLLTTTQSKPYVMSRLFLLCAQIFTPIWHNIPNLREAVAKQQEYIGPMMT